MIDMADYIDRAKLKEDSEYNPVSGEYLSYSRGQIWNAHAEKVIDISVLDKIRAEIEQNAYPIVHGVNNHELGMTLYGILQILDKYKAETEDI